MSKRIINQEAQNQEASLFNLEALNFSGMDSKAINALMERLHKEAMEAKAALRAAEKEAKAAAKEAAREAKRHEGGQIEKLAGILAGIEKDAPLTKREILAKYLECLGIPEEDKASLKKEATLSAQLGSRIAPKLAKLGKKLGSIREEGTIRYYCYPIEG